MALPGWLKEDIAKQDRADARVDAGVSLPYDVMMALGAVGRFIARAVEPESSRAFRLEAIARAARERFYAELDAADAAGVEA